MLQKGSLSKVPSVSIRTIVILEKYGRCWSINILGVIHFELCITLYFRKCLEYRYKFQYVSLSPCPEGRHKVSGHRHLAKNNDNKCALVTLSTTVNFLKNIFLHSSYSRLLVRTSPNFAQIIFRQ